MSAVLEHRVDRLGDPLDAFTRSVGVELNKAYNGQVLYAAGDARLQG
jgi:hypothetical protein